MRSLLDKRLVLVTGKGGTGKTTVAAALGLAAARAGRRTILCEVAGEERTSRALGRAGVGHEETVIAPGLSAISIDPQRALEEYLREAVGSRVLYGLLFSNRIFQYLAAAAPGVRELTTIGKVWELAQLERFDSRKAPYDLVIVDAPATGHGLALMRTPKTFAAIARVGPVRRRAERIHAYLLDRKRTGVVAVALPEEMPVTETVELREALHRDLGMALDLVVMNGLHPERLSSAEGERIGAAEPGAPAPVREALAGALSADREARSQASQLRRLRRGVEGVRVARLPFMFRAELGLDAWQELSRELERRL